MKFFETLKSLFNKNITLLPYQKLDMVSFVRLRNNSIKINSCVEVEEHYNFVLVYYNKVCDVLSGGQHKLNEDTIPKLYRFSKTPFGLKGMSTRTIITDAYYVSLKEFKDNNFKTIDRVTAFCEGQKVKIKLDGTFTMKVYDTLKFMKALCNDYAVIRNKKTMKEICSTVGYEVSKALNNKNFSIDDYIFNKDKILTAIAESVNNHTSTFGIEVSNFNIVNINVNKKYLNEVQLNALEGAKEVKKITAPTEPKDIEQLKEENKEDAEKKLVYVAKSSSNEVNNENNISNENVTSVNQLISENELTKAVEESANKILEDNGKFEKEDSSINDDNKQNKKHSLFKRQNSKDNEDISREQFQNSGRVALKENSINKSIETEGITTDLGDVTFTGYGITKNSSNSNVNKKTVSRYNQPIPQLLSDSNEENISNDKQKRLKLKKEKNRKITNTMPVNKNINENNFQQPRSQALFTENNFQQEYRKSSGQTRQDLLRQEQLKQERIHREKLMQNKLEQEKLRQELLTQDRLKQEKIKQNTIDREIKRNSDEKKVQKQNIINKENRSNTKEIKLIQDNKSYIQNTLKQETPKRRCSICGEVIRQKEAKACSKCGNPIKNYKICMCCGAKNLLENTNCKVCKSVLD